MTVYNPIKIGSKKISSSADMVKTVPARQHIIQVIPTHLLSCTALTAELQRIRMSGEPGDNLAFFVTLCQPGSTSFR